MTGQELANLARTYVGKGYVYGAEGQICTPALVSMLANEYPNVFTSQYIATANNNWTNIQVFDCSGFVCYLAAIPRQSAYQLMLSCSNRKAYNQNSPPEPGSLVYRTGDTFNHCGIYVDNNQVVEASSVNTGVVISAYTGYYKWDVTGSLPGIDYQSQGNWAQPELDEILRRIPGLGSVFPWLTDLDQPIGSMTIGYLVSTIFAMNDFYRQRRWEVL